MESPDFVLIDEATIFSQSDLVRISVHLPQRRLGVAAQSQQTEAAQLLSEDLARRAAGGSPDPERTAGNVLPTLHDTGSAG